MFIRFIITIMLNKFLIFIGVASIMTMLNNSLYDSDVMRYAIYAILLVFVGWSFQISYLYRADFFQQLTSIFLLLVIVNILVSPYQPLYPRIIKYIGYISCFTLGYVFQERNWPIKCNKILLYVTLLLPLFLVSFFDNTPHKTVFFPRSNTYSYFGLSCALFYYTVNKESKNAFIGAFILLSLYIISCSTLGIVVAVFVAVLLINRRNVRLMILSSVMFIGTMLLIIFSDMAIISRMRDVFTVMSAMTWYDWTHLQKMDFYTFTQGFVIESNRTDNASFLWRLAHWQNIMDGFAEDWLTAIPLGLGDNYSITMTGYACHNEYLKIFAENGLIVFSIIIRWIRQVHIVLQNYKVYYFILAVFIYHFSENLIDAFVANSMIYFSLGYVYCKYKHGKLVLIVKKAKGVDINE